MRCLRPLGLDWEERGAGEAPCFVFSLLPHFYNTCVRLHSGAPTHTRAHHLQPFRSAPGCPLADIWPWQCHAHTIQLTDSPMESVFWKPKSSLALNQHAHTQADPAAQFILHIQTHQQSPSNTPVLHILSALSRVSSFCFCESRCVCACVCVCARARVWCQSHIRELFIAVPEATSDIWLKGLLILYWIRGCDKNNILLTLVNGFWYFVKTVKQFSAGI